MARIIPSIVTREDFNGSYGEEQLYEALSSLPDEYTVFHSVRWHKKQIGKGVQWGEADFTIYNPRRGILVVEVKAGGIRHNDMGWIQTNTVTHQSKIMKDPMAQANKSVYEFVDLFAEQGENAPHPHVEPIVWFTSLSNTDDIMPFPAHYAEEIVLTAKDIRNPKAALEKAYDYYNMPRRMNVPDSEANQVINTLSPCFNAIPNLSVQMAEEEYIFNRMTEEQSYLLDYLEEQEVAAIQGGAGTGKTMLAVEKAIRLSQEDKVLFLCFNRFLLKDLISKYASKHPNITFNNLPGYVYEETGIVQDGDGISDFLCNITPDTWPFDHIIIDEGQDFLEDHLILLSSIAEQKGGCFYVFYDKNQLVQQRQTLDWVKSVECRLLLSANCRNTKSIAVTSNKPIGVEKIRMRIDVNGEKPSIFTVKDRDECFQTIPRIIRRYTDNGMLKKDIVILTMQTESSSILANTKSIGSYKLVSEPNNQDILFTTARKFKGLEAKAIIIVDFDKRCFDTDEARRVFYVGTSRAMHYLDIITLADDYELASIAEALQGKPSKNPRATIGSYLKVRFASSI